MMNNNGSTIRRFNRFELKYLIGLQQAEQFKTGLKRYLVPDEYGRSNGRYTLSSLYYDSPDLRCYRENETGLKFRRKLRIRRYETGGVFTDDLLANWVQLKRKEVDAIRIRPTPHEFELYYNI